MDFRTHVVERLRRVPGINKIPTSQRRTEIRLALMDYPDADPDNTVAIEEIDAALVRILPRLKAAVGVTDVDLAELLGKSRATIQAYMTGRLREQLPPDACDKLLKLLDQRVEEIGALRRDLLFAKDHG